MVAPSIAKSPCAQQLGHAMEQWHRNPEEQPAAVRVRQLADRNAAISAIGIVE